MEEYSGNPEPEQSSEIVRNPDLVVLPNREAQLTDVSEQEEAHSAVSDEGQSPPPPIHEKVDLEARCHRVRLCRHRVESDESSHVESEEELEQRKLGLLQRLNEAYRQLDELRTQVSNSRWNHQNASDVEPVDSSSSERRSDRYREMLDSPPRSKDSRNNHHNANSKRNTIDRQTAAQIKRVHCIMEERLREMEERIRRLENMHRKRTPSPNQIIYESRSFREQTNLYNVRDSLPYRRHSKDQFNDYIPSRDMLLCGRSSRDVLLDPTSSMNLALNQRSLSYLDSDYRNPRDYPSSEPRAIMDKAFRPPLSREELEIPTTSKGQTGKKPSPKRRQSPRKVSISHKIPRTQTNIRRSSKGASAGSKIVKCETVGLKSPPRSQIIGETSGLRSPRGSQVAQRSPRTQSSTQTLARFFDRIFSMGGRTSNAPVPSPTTRRATRSPPSSVQSRRQEPARRTDRRNSGSLRSGSVRPPGPPRQSQWQILWEMTTAVEDMTRRLLESRQRRGSNISQPNQSRGSHRYTRAGGSDRRYQTAGGISWERNEVSLSSDNIRRRNRQTGGDSCRFDDIYDVD